MLSKIYLELTLSRENKILLFLYICKKFNLEFINPNQDKYFFINNFYATLFL